MESYSDPALTKKLYALAQAAGILVQYKRTTMGGNDARAIQNGCRRLQNVRCVRAVPVFTLARVGRCKGGRCGGGADGETLFNKDKGADIDEIVAGIM